MNAPTYGMCAYMISITMLTQVKLYAVLITAMSLFHVFDSIWLVFII